MAEDHARIQLRRQEPDLRALVRYVSEGEVLDAGPFRALVSRTTDWANLVMPVVTPTDAGDVAVAIQELQRRFAEYGRTPRVVFKEIFFLGLATLLEEAGLALSEREPLMLCTRASFHPSDNPDVSVRFLHSSDLDADLAAFKRIWSESLADGSWAPTGEALAEFRDEIEQHDQGGAALAFLDGRPVGTGFVAYHGEGCEIMRVATATAARRRRVGSTVTSFLVRSGFENGATIAWLTAASAGAQALYERIGFRGVGDELTFLVAES